MKTLTSENLLIDVSSFLRASWFFFPGLLFIILGFVAFSQLPQGIDLLRQSLEHTSGGKFLIMLGLAFWAFTSWYTSRILAYNNDDLFDEAPKLTTIFPRLLGFLVFTVVGIGLCKAQDKAANIIPFFTIDTIVFIIIYFLSNREKELQEKREKENLPIENNYITEIAIGISSLGFLALFFSWNVTIWNLGSLVLIQIGSLIWVSFRNQKKDKNTRSKINSITTGDQNVNLKKPDEKNDYVGKMINFIFLKKTKIVSPDLVERKIKRGNNKGKNVNVQRVKKRMIKKRSLRTEYKTQLYFTEHNIFIGYHIIAILAIICYFTIIGSITVGRNAGSFVFLLLAFGILLGLGNMVALISYRTKISWHLIAIAVIGIAGIFVEPHQVRTIKLTAFNGYNQRPDLKTYLKRWINDPIRSALITQDSIPVFFILADGGASRSGYWTANILSRLHESTKVSSKNYSLFQQHLLGLAGASGGSVGNASFVTALVAQQRDSCLLTSNLNGNFLKLDFLTNALARMLGPEFVKTLFNPLWGDRADALEYSMESPNLKDTSSIMMAKMMASNINQLFVKPGFVPPILCINTTSMQDGTPGVISNIQDALFKSRKDVLKLLCPQDGMRISTAMVLGARFPYLSPAGRIGDDYFVDGSYFDNSGAGPIIEIIDKIQQLKLDPDTYFAKIIQKMRFHVIHIQNTPLKKSNLSKVHPFFNDLAAPIITLIGSYGTQTNFNDERLTNIINRSKGSYRRVNLYKKEKETYPMNWVISNPSLLNIDTAVMNEKFVDTMQNHLSHRQFRTLKFIAGNKKNWY